MNHSTPHWPFDTPYPFNFGPLTPGLLFLATFLTAAITINLIVVGSLMIKKRKHRYVVYRYPQTLLPLLTYNCLQSMVVLATFYLGKEDTCDALVVVILIATLFGAHYYAQSPNLLLANHLNANKLSYSMAQQNPSPEHGDEEGSEEGKKMFLRYRRLQKYLTPRFIYLYGLASVIITVAIFLAFRYTTDLPGDCMRTAILSTDIFTFALILAMTYFNYLQRKVQDPLFLKTEVSLGGLLTLPSLLITFIYPIAPGIFPEWFDYRWNLYPYAISAQIFDLVFPVMLTYPRTEKWFLKHKHEEHSDLEMGEGHDNLVENLSQKVDPFQTMMEDPALYEPFKDFCAKQWCAENLLFIKEVERFKERSKQIGKPNQAAALRIFQEFVVMDAPLEINIDDPTRKQIEQAITEVQLGADFSAHIFDKAETEVTKNLKGDAFDKWKLRGHLKEALKKKKKMRATSSELSGLGSGTGGVSSRKPSNFGARVHSKE